MGNIDRWITPINVLGCRRPPMLLDTAIMSAQLGVSTLLLVHLMSRQLEEIELLRCYRKPPSCSDLTRCSHAPTTSSNPRLRVPSLKIRSQSKGTGHCPQRQDGLYLGVMGGRVALGNSGREGGVD